MRSGVYEGSRFEALELFGDHLLLRVVDAGEVQVIEFTSEDPEWLPPHSHPWHEVVYVIEGEVEFRADEHRGRGGPGSVQMLRQGDVHSLRIASERARLLMITMGAPYDGFAREVAGLGYEGYPPVDQLYEIAGRHGLRPAPNGA